MDKCNTDIVNGSISIKQLLMFFAMLLGMVFLMSGVAAAAPGDLPTPGYLQWVASGPNLADPTPHLGYATATRKCAVCHSMHGASIAGVRPEGSLVPTYTGSATELLLPSSVSDSCTFCHISTTVSSKHVYDSSVANYEGDNSGHNKSGAPCIGCHSVHGANTIGSGAIYTKILVTGQEQGLGGETTATNIVIPYAPTSANKDEAISAFCTNCHKLYSASSETTVTFWGYNDETMTVELQNSKHHPMVAAGSGPIGAGSTYTGKVAWVDALYCRSCHDAGIDGTDFPHYDSDAARFLNVAADSSAAATGAVDSSDDGACLKCHVNGLGAGGVSDTF